MSENPNPTVCGNCQTENPPGAEFCDGCGEPLTLSAELSDGEPGSVADPDMPLDSPESTDPSSNPFPTD